MRFLLLLAALFAVLGVRTVRASDEYFETKRPDLDIWETKDLDLEPEQARDLARHLVPGARVGCYGPIGIAVLGRPVERWAVFRLLARHHRDPGWPGFHHPRCDMPRHAPPVPFGGPEERLAHLRAEAKELARLVAQPHGGFVVGRIFNFEEDVRSAVQRLEDRPWHGSLEEYDRSRVEFLELRLEAGRLLHRIEPYDLPPVDVTRHNGERLLAGINQIGRDGAHDWRPGLVPPYGAWRPRTAPPQEDYATVRARDTLEEALRLLRRGRGRQGVLNRSHAYLLIANEWRQWAGRLGLPAELPTGVSPRLQEVIDFVDRVGRAVEGLRARAQRRMR